MIIINLMTMMIMPMKMMMMMLAFSRKGKTKSPDPHTKVMIMNMSMTMSMKMNMTMKIMTMLTFSRKGRTKMSPGPRTKAMSRVDPKTTARSYSGICSNFMLEIKFHEEYRRLARHSPRAEANIAKACNTMQLRNGVIRYHKIPYHT